MRRVAVGDAIVVVDVGALAVVVVVASGGVGMTVRE